MTVLTCPFCNTSFDAPSLPGRIVCPRCGEAIPAKLLPATAGTIPDATLRAGPVETAPTGPRPAMVAALVLLIAALVGLGIWYYTAPVPPGNTNTTDRAPPPTRPPYALPGMLYLPAETNAALALQPSALIQYGQRIGKSPEAILADFGLPTGFFAGLKSAGIPFERIDHVVLGVSIADSPIPRLALVLILNEPIAGERQFREAVKLRQNADKPGRAKVELPGLLLPMEMHRVDERIYLFSTDSDALDRMAKPAENADRISASLRDSIRRIDAASFAWAAIDDRDWANLPALKLIAPMLQQPELPKRLTGIRAVAVGLTLTPDLAAQANVRFADPIAAGEFEARSKPKLADTRIAMGLDREWVTLALPGVSFANGIPALLKLFDK